MLTTLTFLIPKSLAYSMNLTFKFEVLSFNFNSSFERPFTTCMPFTHYYVFWKSFKILRIKANEHRNRRVRISTSCFMKLFVPKGLILNIPFAVPFESWTTPKKLEVIFYLFTQFIILILKLCRAEFNWSENKTSIQADKTFEALKT